MHSSTIVFYPGSKIKAWFLKRGTYNITCRGWWIVHSLNLIYAKHLTFMKSIWHCVDSPLRSDELEMESTRNKNKMREKKILNRKRWARLKRIKAQKVKIEAKKICTKGNIGSGTISGKRQRKRQREIEVLRYCTLNSLKCLYIVFYIV